MTVELTTSWQRISKQQKSFSYGGNSYTFTLRTHAHYEKISNTVARIHYKLELTNDGNTYWSGTNKNYYIHLNGQGPTDVQWTNRIDVGGVYTLWEGHLDLSPNVEYSLHGKFNIPVATSWDIADNVKTPAFYTKPAQPSVIISSKTHNSATFSVSLSSYGNPSSVSGRYIEAAILGQDSYGASYRFSVASNTTSATITVNNSSNASPSTFNIEGNHKYWYGGYATNTQLSNSIVTGTFYTPCPPFSALSSSTQTYTAYNKVSATISYTRQSDSGAETRTGYYRYSADNGQNYSEWTSFGTVSSTTGNFQAANLPTASSIILEAKLNTPNGGDSGVLSTTFNTLNTHSAPNFSNFTYIDSNSASVAITGNDQIMVLGQSIPRITISTSNRATGNDGIAVTSYSYNFAGRSGTADYSSTSSVIKNLDAPLVSGTQIMSVSAVDALSMAKAVTKNVTVYPWSAPTIEASVERTNNFESETTLKISGTWAPIHIGNTDKNTLQVAYRNKKTSSSTWGSWQTRPVTKNGENYSTVDLVISCDNTAQWDFEVRAVDVFTTTTVSMTLSVGVPIFFVGDDGRVSVNGNPSVPLAQGDTGHLEVNGHLYVNGEEVGGNVPWVKASDIIWSTMIDKIYPVGSIFMSATLTTATAVGNALGGTWQAWGAGRVPVGVDTTQTEFNTVSKTGGEKTHTLTVEEIPDHHHAIYGGWGDTAGGKDSWRYQDWGANNAKWNYEGDLGTSHVGGGQSHNNLQPYITCYMYKRTA